MLPRMCRNIRPLFNFEPPATDEEIHAAALQYVRKVSGTRQPSGRNSDPFERAIAEIATVLVRDRAAATHGVPPRTRSHRRWFPRASLLRSFLPGRGGLHAVTTGEPRGRRRCAPARGGPPPSASLALRGEPRAGAPRGDENAQGTIDTGERV